MAEDAGSQKSIRGVAQLVARVVRDDEAAGSSPVTPTNERIMLLFINVILFLMPGMRS